MLFDADSVYVQACLQFVKLIQLCKVAHRVTSGSACSSGELQLLSQAVDKLNGFPVFGNMRARLENFQRSPLLADGSELDTCVRNMLRQNGAAAIDPLHNAFSLHFEQGTG